MILYRVDYITNPPLNVDEETGKRSWKRSKGAEMLCNIGFIIWHFWLSTQKYRIYSKFTILREQEVIPGFIISGHNLNTIRCANVTVLIEDRNKTTEPPRQDNKAKLEEKKLALLYGSIYCSTISSQVKKWLEGNEIYF